jgi:xanthine/CO dehydrogenase XdhC/CoxF family maturation factor
LSRSDIPYIGLLGPKDRRRRLLEDLGADAGDLEGRLHGPAGLDIAAVGPAAIALSILAEMHGALANA